ncbi:MAG: nucleotidyltransferase domain-containing protein [Thermoguttaceae bacterium]|jgi:predicted nucleotidyltransferase
MIPDLPKSIRRLIDYGINTVAPDRVILFGSRARGDAREDSDYDLAFDFSSERRLFWLRFVTAAADVPITLRPTDLVAWHEASPALQDHIKHEGIIIYDRSKDL